MNPGTILNQRYTLAARVGKGAMGDVYRATDAQTGQAVAIKVIARDLALDSEMLERFKREAEALRQLKHPNIVGFVDAFQHEGQHFIVMEYISGGSLHDLVKKGPLPPERVRHIALDLCDALIRAHRLDIIHRDLKPENVLLTPEGTPKLTDFGVARLIGEGTRLTGTGTQVGTPYYMSPEAWEGKPLDAQTDIWSLGVMLYEMLAGEVPFGGGTAAAVMSKVLTAAAPDLRAAHPNLPPAMTAIIRRMLTRDKGQRYQTVRQVALELEQGAAPARPAPASAPKPAHRRGARVGGVIGLAAILGLAVLAAALVGGWFLWNSASAAQHATQTAVALAALPTETPRPSPTPTIPAPTASPSSSPSPRPSATPFLTPVPPTATLQPTPTVTPTKALPTPDPKFTPVIGSTQVAPKDGAVMVFVPASDFQMGTEGTNNADEKPVHWVSLDGYWIDRTEVTNAMFARFVAEAGYQTDAEKGGDGYLWAGSAWKREAGANWQHSQGASSNLAGKDTYPVTLVSWNDAAAYCAWAGRRLPTEAEWEKAARGRNALRYPWATSIFVAGNLLNFADKNLKASQADSTIDDGYELSAPVGHYPDGASPYGALDMAGNVQEWVADWYSDTYYQDPKAASRGPTGPAAGTQKVLRGGSWFSAAKDVRTTARNRDNPASRYGDYGFRCVQSLGPVPK